MKYLVFEAAKDSRVYHICTDDGKHTACNATYAAINDEYANGRPGPIIVNLPPLGFRLCRYCYQRAKK